MRSPAVREPGPCFTPGHERPRPLQSGAERPSLAVPWCGSGMIPVYWRRWEEDLRRHALCGADGGRGKFHDRSSSAYAGRLSGATVGVRGSRESWGSMKTDFVPARGSRFDVGCQVQEEGCRFEARRGPILETDCEIPGEIGIPAHGHYAYSVLRGLDETFHNMKGCLSFLRPKGRAGERIMGLAGGFRLPRILSFSTKPTGPDHPAECHQTKAVPKGMQGILMRNSQGDGDRVIFATRFIMSPSGHSMETDGSHAGSSLRPQRKGPFPGWHKLHSAAGNRTTNVDPSSISLFTSILPP